MKTIEITQSQTHKVAIKANENTQYLTLEAIQNAQQQIAPDGVKIAYTDLFFDQELVKAIIAYNEANPKSPIKILFGDNDLDKDAVQNLATNPNATRIGIGNQASAFENMLASDYSKAAIGIVTVIKSEDLNAPLLKNLFTESLQEVSSFAKNNPNTTFIVPAIFDKENNPTINIGTNIAAGKLAGNGTAVKAIQNAIDLSLNNILNGINMVPTVSILTQKEVEAHRGIYDIVPEKGALYIYNDPVRGDQNFLNIETVAKAAQKGSKIIYAQPFYDQTFIKSLISYNEQHPEAPIYCLFGEEDIRKEKSNANSLEARGSAGGPAGALAGLTYAEANKASFGITTAKKSNQVIEQAFAWFSSIVEDTKKAEKSIKDLIGADLEALINFAKINPGAKFIVPIALNNEKMEISIGKGTAAKHLGSVEDQVFVYNNIKAVINEIEVMVVSPITLSNNDYPEVIGEVSHDHN